MNCTIEYFYALSLHDALPILSDRRRGCEHALHPRGDQSLTACRGRFRPREGRQCRRGGDQRAGDAAERIRSEEHTSELQSRGYLVCRLLLEKKKNRTRSTSII